MSAEKLYSEIFEEFDNAKNKAERIAVLRKYDHARFREFLNYVFNPNIKFDVEIPNYRIAVEPAGLNYTYLSAEMPKMYRFIVGHPMRADGLSSTKQKQLLAVILESLHKDESALLVKLLKKNLGIKHLNLNLVLEAFPGI
jgi:hypothetical protein